jgi:hypothetical protein
VNQELLLRNEYLTAENRILGGQIKGWLLLSEPEKATLAEIAHRLPRMVLEDAAATPKPDMIFRRSVGRPKVDQEAERSRNADKRGDIAVQIRQCMRYSDRIGLWKSGRSGPMLPILVCTPEVRHLS